MNMRQRTEHYRNQETLSYNCAECVLLGANDCLHLQIDTNTLKALGAYGGGAGCGSMCGALASAISVLGIVYTKEGKATRFSPKTHEKTTELVTWFKETYGSELCAYIKEENEKKGVTCSPLIFETAQKLEALID